MFSSRTAARLFWLTGLACFSFAALGSVSGCGSSDESAQPVPVAGAPSSVGGNNNPSAGSAGAPSAGAGTQSAGAGGSAAGASGASGAAGSGNSGAPGDSAGSAGALGGSGGRGSVGAGGASSAGSAGTAGAPSNGDYNPCPAAPAPCVVLPFGDSITYGYGSTDAGGYRSQVFALAVADGKALTFVGSSADGPSMVSGKAFPRNHEGHPSYTITGTKGIAQYVDQGIIKQFKPNIVLLMIGTNDISQNIDLANAPTRLGKLIDSIFVDAPSALIILAKITPSQKEPANTDTTTYNSALPAMIKTRTAQGKRILLVDMNAPFLANSNWKKALMTDSVHPNDAGYVIMGKTWYAALRDVLH